MSLRIWWTSWSVVGSGYASSGRRQVPALEGCSEEVGVADGGRCEGGVPWVWGGWAGWVAGVLCVYVDVWLVLAGLGRVGW